MHEHGVADHLVRRTDGLGAEPAAPVRSFLSTETGGAIVMLGAAIAALIWANMSPHSYESVWTTQLSIHLGSHGLGTDLRHWVNEGLMALFFLVVGLEAKRELDLASFASAGAWRSRWWPRSAGC